MRNVVLAVTALALVVSAARAQNADWGNKLFDADAKGPLAHDFGSVPRGAQLYHRFPMKNIWKVSEVVKNDAPVDVVLQDWYRQPGEPGKFGYHVKVKLKPDAPAGAHKWELHLKTNDPTGPQVPLFVEATVQSTLSVSPGTLN